MWPLLKKDGLATQYIALTLLCNRLIGHGPFIVKSDIFGHAYMGMVTLLFIDASDFSNLPTPRQVIHLC